MANEVLVKDGPNSVTFANHAGDFAPAAGSAYEIGTPIDVELALAGGSGVAATEARMSAKANLGTPRAPRYAVMAIIEFFSAPAAGGTVDFYWAPSPSSTAGNANPAGVSGSDADYTGDGGGTVAESVRQLDYIGSMVVTDLSGIQEAVINPAFEPSLRYGCLVVVNNTSVTIAATDDVETHIVFLPAVDEIQ